MHLIMIEEMDISKGGIMNLFSKDSNNTGKGELLELLYMKYNKLMYYVAYDILDDHHLTEDAVQTAFYKLSKTNYKIDSISCNKTKAFMVIIVRNVALSIYNKNKQDSNAFEENEIEKIPDDTQTPLDLIISKENVERVQFLLSTLNPIYSDITMLRYFCDYSISEIGALIDQSEQLIRVRLFRGRKLLSQKLKEDIENE